MKRHTLQNPFSPKALDIYSPKNDPFSRIGYSNRTDLKPVIPPRRSTPYQYNSSTMPVLSPQGVKPFRLLSYNQQKLSSNTQRADSVTNMHVIYPPIISHRQSLGSSLRLKKGNSLKDLRRGREIQDEHCPRVEVSFGDTNISWAVADS